MKTRLTYLCLLTFQLSAQAEVIVKSSFNNSLESGAEAVWKGKEPEYVQGVGVEGTAVHLNGEHRLSLWRSKVQSRGRKPPPMGQNRLGWQ
jgi:hypothetical protein